MYVYEIYCIYFQWDHYFNLQIITILNLQRFILFYTSTDDK